MSWVRTVTLRLAVRTAIVVGSGSEIDRYHWRIGMIQKHQRLGDVWWNWLLRRIRAIVIKNLIIDQGVENSIVRLSRA